MSHPAREGGSRPVACNYCKLKKIRCNGESTCSNCQLRHEICRYPPVRQRRNRRASNHNSKALEERLTQLEELLRQSHGHGQGREIQVQTKNPEPANGLLGTSGVDETQSEHLRRRDKMTVDQEEQLIYNIPSQDVADMIQSPSPKNRYNPESNFDNMGRMSQISSSTDEIFGSGPEPEYSPSPFSFDHLNSTVDYSFHVSPCLTPPALSSGTLGLIGSPITSSSLRKVCKSSSFSGGRPKSSIISPDNIQTNESYRPGSLLSICSPAGIAWVAERTGSSEFGDCAQMLTMDISGRRKPMTKAPFERNPEPDQEEAWKYCQAYFEHTLESVFGIVNRQDFEGRLRAHFAHPDADDDDAGWYALRNAVYASGCNAEYSKSCYTMRFEDAKERSWKYFGNALSVQTELLYGQTDISALQALIAMCYFTEGVRNPTLAYALCSNALLLAQAKGLHQNTPASSTDSQIPDRNWLFWAIYCYATHVACLSGRAPVIDDDTITCELPTEAAEGSTINIEIFTQTITLCRISSTIFKTLSAIKTLSRTPEEVIRVLSNLHWQILQWRDSQPPSLRPDGPINPSQIPPGYHLYHLLFLHYSYYGSLMAIHSIYAYPWNSSLIGSSSLSSVREQINTSSTIVIEASRNIILATKYIDINASLPGWLLIYYPLVGFLNAFIHVVKNPTLPSTEMDLALMDMIVGHFGHLGFLSDSNMAFAFPRQIAMLTSTVVMNARKQDEIRSSLSIEENEFESNLFPDIRDIEPTMFEMDNRNVLSAIY